MCQKGVSNQDVCARSGLNPAELLLNRARSNLQRREQPDAPLCELGLRRLRQVVNNLERLGDDSPSILTVRTQASEIFLSGVWSILWLAGRPITMHIKSKRREIHEGAKVRYSKSKHSMFGIPMCKFCLQMQCDWQSLEKHITMGGCACITSALAQGTANPPQPPEAIAHTLSQKVYSSRMRAICARPTIPSCTTT